MATQKFKPIGSSIMTPIDDKKRRVLFVIRPVKTIKRLYWTYGDDENIVTDKSRFYVDLNLHADTENYSVGEMVEVSIEGENGQDIAEGIGKITLSLPVGQNQQAKLRNVFEGKKINLFSQEYV